LPTPKIKKKNRWAHTTCRKIGGTRRKLLSVTLMGVIFQWLSISAVVLYKEVVAFISFVYLYFIGDRIAKLVYWLVTGRTAEGSEFQSERGNIFLLST
jgi:hypothetical protein